MPKPESPPGKPEKPEEILPPEAVVERNTSGELIGAGALLQGASAIGSAIAPSSDFARVHSIQMVLP